MFNNVTWNNGGNSVNVYIFSCYCPHNTLRKCLGRSFFYSLWYRDTLTGRKGVFCSANPTFLVSNHLADNCIQSKLITGTIFLKQPFTECLSWKLMTHFFQVFNDSLELQPRHTVLHCWINIKQRISFDSAVSTLKDSVMGKYQLPKYLTFAGVCLFRRGMEDETQTDFSYLQYLIKIPLYRLH